MRTTRIIAEKLLFTTMLGAGLVFSTLMSAGTAQAGGYETCHGFTNADVDGYGNDAVADVANCAELTLHQRGGYNGAYIEMNGASRMASSQRGASELDATVYGDEHDVISIQRNGAQTEIEIDGHDDNTALYNDGGYMRVQMNGVGNNLKMTNRNR